MEEKVSVTIPPTTPIPSMKYIRDFIYQEGDDIIVQGYMCMVGDNEIATILLKERIENIR